MTRPWGRIAAISLLVVAACVAALLATAWVMLPLDGLSMTLDGETFSLADLDGTGAVLVFLLVVGAVMIALFATLSMVAVGLFLGALGIAIGLLATVATLALVAAPFALVVWAVWRLARPRPRAPAVAAAP